VVASCGKLGRAPTQPIKIVSPNVNAMELDVVFDMRTNRMNVESTKILSELFLLLGANVLKVLVAEHDNASLSNQQRELVPLHVCQLRQLQPFDLCADTGRKLCCLERDICSRKQVGFRRICMATAVHEIKQWSWRISGCVVENRKVGNVLGLRVWLVSSSSLRF
jgi:hypothetical protein